MESAPRSTEVPSQVIRALHPSECKICAGCRRIRPRSAFNKNASRSDGLQTYCRDCKARKDAASNAKRKDRIATASATWKKTHREAHNAHNRAWRARRKQEPTPAPVEDEIVLLVPEPVPEPLKACLTCGNAYPASSFPVHGKLASVCGTCRQIRDREQRERRRAQTRRAVKVYAQAHPERVRANNQRRRSRKAEAPINDFTEAEWRALLDLYDGRCAYCGARAPLTQDHVVPLAKGGSNTLANIVPACKPCNERKGTRDDWIPRRPITTRPLCECGCGLPLPAATREQPRRGSVRGQTTRFIKNHDNRKPGTPGQVSETVGSAPADLVN